jgi:hypothetical protein
VEAETSLDEIRDFGHDERRYDERAWVRGQELEAREMIVVRLVQIGVERAGVYERSGRPSSCARISSMRAAVSL